MPQTLITTPGFEHGLIGYRRGCNCDTCRRAATKHTAWLALRRSEGTALPTQTVDASEVRTHLQGILDAHPTLTSADLARASGASVTGTWALLSGRHNTVRRSRVDALLAVTADAAYAARVRIPVSEVEVVIRQLQAAGYTIDWILRRCGISTSDFLYRPQGWMFARQADAIRAVHTAYADTPATPDNSGQLQHSINRTRKIARSYGVWPVWHLDAMGNLDFRSIRDHPWSRLDAAADDRLSFIRDAIAAAGEVSIGEVADRHGIDGRRAQRWLTKVGVRIADPDTFTGIRALLAEYDDGADPVVIALRMGALVDYALPDDHPGVLTYRQIIAAETATGTTAAATADAVRDRSVRAA